MARTVFRYPEAYATPLVVLKEGALFYLGDLEAEASETSAGLYFQDTRFLSRLRWRLAGEPLTLLSGTVDADARAQIDLTNPELRLDGRIIPPRSLHLRVTAVVSDRLFQHLKATSFLSEPLQVALTLSLAADFTDLFELRGLVRPARGAMRPPRAGASGAVFAYQGRDGLMRLTEVAWEPEAATAEVGAAGEVEARFVLELAPRGHAELTLAVTPKLGEEPAADTPRMATGQAFARAVSRQARSYREWEAACTRVESDNPFYDAMLRQAVIDLRTLTTDYPGEGRIVDAGIPWYVAPFGRDSLITGIESLLLTDTVAKDSLRFLAHHQGQKDDPWRDEEPGKILHELRRGEMARCGEIPHTPYYGSVDSTLWWVIALGETVRFTGDRSLAEELAEPLRAALRWIVEWGDRDGDHLLEYRRRSPMGLENQGWKDSHDAVQGHDGEPVRPPVALVEVQGYAYRALQEGARLLRAVGDRSGAQACQRQAVALRQAFLAAFWDREGGRLAYALDGDKRPVWAPVSNTGQLLFTDILPRRLARQVVAGLFEREMFSGFGVRTLGQGARFYNPISYHNGSVWPHDNAIIAWGLRRLGEGERLIQVGRALYEAAQHFAYGRLPELFGGFPRRSGAGPVRYPVACDPQAWAVAATPFLLRLMLGLEVRGREVIIDRPLLPPWVEALTVSHLRVGGGMLDVEFARHRGVTYANVLRTEGDLRLSIRPG